MAATTTQATLDPITFTVLRHRLDEVIAEAYHTIGRVSGSPVVYEAGDHQEAICTPNGDLVVFGAGVLHWTQALGAGVKHIVRTFAETPGFQPDDQFMLSDHYIAPIHGCDVQMLAPVHYEGEIIAWVGSASHQTDIGGIDPGSLCVSAENVFQEGFLTPGLKLVEGGVVRGDVEETFRNMVRAPDLGVLDLRAKVASNNVMKERLVEMVEKYGLSTIRTLFTQLMNYSEDRIRARLRSLPDGTWSSTNYIEGVKDPVLRGKATIVKKDDQLTIDLTGSSPQTMGSENIGPVGARSSAVNPYVAMLCHDLPWNEGLFRPLEFILPEASVVNAQRPAAVSTNTPAGANILIETTAQNAFSKMLLTSDEYRSQACGNLGGSFNIFVLAGEDREGAIFTTLIMDLLAGGQGGHPERDGTNSSANHWCVKNMIANVESTEMLYPILYLWRSEMTDSAGPGRFRGGSGLSDALIAWGAESLVDVNLGIGAEQRGSLGLSGGYPGGNTPATLIRGADVPANFFAVGRLPGGPADVDGERVPVPVKGVISFDKHDVLMGVMSGGGGGFGDPIDRDPAAVLRDVIDGYVSTRAARDVYGVVLDDAGEGVLEAETEQLRKNIRNDRIERMGAL